MKEDVRKRFLWVIFFLFFLFSLLIAQFFKIQIMEREKWTKVAERQHFFYVNEPFRRGSFISNSSIKRAHPEDPQRIVVDIQKYHLYIDPVSIPEEHRDPVASFLINQCGVKEEQRQRFRQQFNKKSRSRKLMMWLDEDIRDSVQDWWRTYSRKHRIARNAIFFVSDYQRSYPFEKLLGPVLHTIREQKDEKTKQAYPTGGLELYFNDYLKGKQGKRRLKRSPRNRFETGEVVSSPQHGADIYLTINHCLQSIAEEEVRKGVKKCKAKSGWAAMMDPKTGEILALAQYPFFYPEFYSRYYNDPVLVEHARVRAVTDALEPGSVMKALTLTIALHANKVLEARGEEKLFDPEEKVATLDSRFPGRRKPLKDTHPHRFLNMKMASQKSANIYMARLVQKIVDRLGKGWYRDVLQNTFGFGLKTNIELPAETAGVLPTPGKLHPNGRLEWSVPTPFSLAIGHNIQVNSIQLLRAYALLANGGYFVQPTIVRKIVKGKEILLDHTDPKRVENFPRLFDDEILQEVITAMKYTTKLGGTAPKADVWGYTEVGKTGTTEKISGGTYSKKEHIASFVGFTPVSDPAFVLIVVMDEPEYGFIPGWGKNHHGGNACAPVFSVIAKRSLEYLGIAPDDPHGYPRWDPRYDPDKADWIAETRLLRKLYNEWNETQTAH